MIEQVLSVIESSYPDHKWSYETATKVADTIYRFHCDGADTKVGFSTKTAEKLASLGGENAVNQTIKIVMMQISNYMESMKDGEKTEGNREIGETEAEAKT